MIIVCLNTYSKTENKGLCQEEGHKIMIKKNEITRDNINLMSNDFLYFNGQNT